ncbi:MAG: hypothetical protein JRN26_06545 [Nitrososphaerota archaeon]|jgi:hypothetical protein|nr:hypothetical protein [Nitrososphaerota archaeon]MDG6936521.1 hypothetical protein [Nitrososphaerota archaeon]MDG6944996.1 hypothetical protein [Nitrososphaerota archaeon]
MMMNREFIKLIYATLQFKLAMNVKSLIVILLAISIAAPTITTSMAAATTHAASNPVLPTVSSNAQVFEQTQSSLSPTYTFVNPVSGGSITSISVNIPKSIASAVSSTVTVTGIPSGVPYTAVVYGNGPWTIVISGTSGAIILPAGASITVEYSFTPVSSLPSAGTVGAVTATSVTYSNGNTYSLASPELYVTAASGYTITPPSSSFEAGTNGLFSVEATAPSGVTVSWVPVYLYVPIPSSAPSSAMVTYPEVLNVSSTQATSFDVNATYASPYTITASGSSSGSSATGEISSSSASFTVIAGTPTQVMVSLSSDVSGYSTDYATSPVTVTSISLADAFGNPVTIPSGSKITLSTSAGTLETGGSLTWGSPSGASYGTQLSATLTSSASSVSGPVLYPPVSYGSSSQLSASITVPTSSSYAGTYSGTSNVVITSTNAYMGPTVLTTLPAKAGQSINVQVQLTFPSLVSGSAKTVDQSNVPVSFLVSTSSTAPYSAPSHATPVSEVVNTNSSGYATFTFTETSTSESPVYVWVSIPQPETGAATHMLASNVSTSGITITAGSPSALKIITTPSKYVAINGTASVNVELTDAYGNLATVPSTSGAIQITLSASAGTLSATTVYITAGESSTSVSGYAVTYTAPASAVTVTLTASATGLTSATKTLDVISKYPMLGVTSPANGKVVTTQNITVSAWAAPSPAAPTGTYITTFMYSLNGAANKSVAITSTNSSGYDFYSFPVTLASGLNTIKLYATDSQGLTSEYTVTYTLSTVPPTPAQTIIFPTSAPPMQATVAGYHVINVTMYNNVSTTLTAIPVVVLSNSQYSWVAIGNPTSISPGSTVISLVSVQNIPAGTYTAKVFIVESNGATISGYKTFTVTIS